MDPIGASCFSLHIAENEKAIIEERKQDEKFNEIIVSCRSLSTYDGRTLKTLLPQIMAAVVAATFHLVIGISLAFSAIVVPDLTRNITNNETDSGDITATKEESSWIASVIVIITPISAVIGGFIMDAIGRVNMLKLATLPLLIGWILIATAVNVPMIIIGRLLVGFGSTWGTSPAIVYITEIARADMRGSLISLTPTLASLGMMVCFLKGWFLHWRIVAWTANVYVILAFVLLFFIPESPAWLVTKGRIDQALKSLDWINKYQPHPENRHESLAQLQLHHLQKEHQTKLEEMERKGYKGGSAKFKEFLKPTGYKPIIILSGLFFLQQFSGIYITLFYSVTFFKEVGATMNAYFASVLIAAVRMAMSCINTYMLKSFHRRPLVITSGVGMAACMGFSGLFTHWLKTGQSEQTWVPVLLILLYVVTSMIGLLPIPWTMTAELFPIEIRGVAHSIAYSIANVLMFGAVQSYWALTNTFGGASGLQWFFAVVALTASVYSLIFLPETHGKKLSEITEYFNHNMLFLGSNTNKTTDNKKQKKPAVRKDIVKSNVKADNDQSEKLINAV